LNIFLGEIFLINHSYEILWLSESKIFIKECKTSYSENSTDVLMLNNLILDIAIFAMHFSTTVYAWRCWTNS